MIALVDCDSFYCSCHAVFEPALANSAISVASNNDGNLISLNKQAKSLGLKMGDPVFKVQHIIKKHDVRVFSSSFYLYGDMSRRVMQVLSTFSPEQEIYSIDEAWLSLAGLDCDLTGYGTRIAQRVKQWTGIPVSIGIAPTKTLTKIAARLVKKNLVNTGPVCEWGKLENQDGYLRDLSVTDIWGISTRLGMRLAKLGIHDALALKQAGPKYIRQHFGVVLERTVLELRGTPCIPLGLAPPPKKQIMVSRSFGDRLTRLDELRAAISAFATLAGEKLRKAGLCANSINVFVATSPFDTSAPPYSNAVTVAFGQPCQDTGLLISAAVRGLGRIYKPGFKYQRAGVMMLDLAPKTTRQMSLFNQGSQLDTRSDLLMSVIDNINRKYGRGTVRHAGVSLSGAWRMKQANLSPAYTTRWEDLPVVLVK